MPGRVDTGTHRFHVSFKLWDDWEWVAIDAKHHADAKKQVLDELGEGITEWGYVHPTDSEQSIEMMLKIREGRKIGEVAIDLLKGLVRP